MSGAAVAAPHDEHDFDDGTADERGFGIHIAIGGAVGIPLFVVLLTVLLRLKRADTSLEDAGIVAVWAGLWVGLFLGGCLGVGLWLLNRERHGHGH